MFYLFTSLSKEFLSRGVLFILAFPLASGVVLAVPIDPNVTITGLVMPGAVIVSPGDGTQTQSGIVSSIVGGVLTELPCPERCDSTVASPGTEGLMDTLTDLGDGFGTRGTITASVGPGETGARSNYANNYVFNLMNNSLVDSFLITFKILFDDQGTGVGGNSDSAGVFLLANSFSFADSFSSDAGNPFGGAFESMFTHVGMTTLEILLAPGQSDSMFAIHDAGVQVFSVGSSYEVDLESFISIESVERLPANVPEPTTLALFGLGLTGLGFARRKRA